MKRWGYRIAEISKATGLSRDAVDAHAQREGVPRRKIGEAVLLEARKVEEVFGFGEPAPAPRASVMPSREVLEQAARMVSR